MTRRELLAEAKELFAKLFTRRVAVRLIGVNVTNLETDRRQHELFDTDANRRWYLNRGLDFRPRPLRLERRLLRQRTRTPRTLRHQARRPSPLHSLLIALMFWTLY